MNDPDDQPARPISRAAGTDSITARIQSLRSRLGTDGHITAQQQVALDAIDREAADRRLLAARERARPHHGPPRDDWDSQDATSPNSLVRERRRGFRHTPTVNRQRERMARLARAEPPEQTAPVTTASPALHNPRIRQASVEQEVEPQPFREGRYPKRRKLDDGTSDDASNCPTYTLGSEGTLIPGNLRMKVIDVGDSDYASQLNEGARSSLHMVENRHCFRSKNNKCSILMKHQGGWPFTLSKLEVKLPHHDRDAGPLQGMVFVSMGNDDLLDQSSYYDSLIPLSHTLHKGPRRYDSYRPAYDYFHDSRPPTRSQGRTQNPIEPHDAHWYEADTRINPKDVEEVPGFAITIDNISIASDDTATSPRSPRPWHDQDHEYSRRQYDLHDRVDYTTAQRYRRLRLPLLQTESDRTTDTYEATATAQADADPDADAATASDSDDERMSHYIDTPRSQREVELDSDRRRAVPEPSRAQRDRPYYTAEPAQYEDDDGFDPAPDYMMQIDELNRRRQAAGRSSIPPPYSSTKRLPGCNEMLQGQAAQPPSAEAKLLPHAKFQLTREGGGITVNFEPAVSGKYILVKLWAQCPHSVVTVQNIVPWGYAGLRQVPDLSFR